MSAWIYGDGPVIELAQSHTVHLEGAVQRAIAGCVADVHDDRGHNVVELREERRALDANDRGTHILCARESSAASIAKPADQTETLRAFVVGGAGVLGIRIVAAGLVNDPE